MHPGLGSNEHQKEVTFDITEPGTEVHGQSFMAIRYHRPSSSPPPWRDQPRCAVGRAGNKVLGAPRAKRYNLEPRNAEKMVIPLSEGWIVRAC